MTIEIDGTTLYSLPELSEKFGLGIRTLRRYLHSGRLVGRKMGKMWYVSAESIKEYFETKGSSLPPSSQEK